MITKVKQNFTALIFSALTDDKFAKLSIPRKHFIAHTCTVYEVRGMKKRKGEKRQVRKYFHEKHVKYAA